jgi:hypothetical protein
VRYHHTASESTTHARWGRLRQAGNKAQAPPSHNRRAVVVVSHSHWIRKFCDSYLPLGLSEQLTPPGAGAGGVPGSSAVAGAAADAESRAAAGSAVLDDPFAMKLRTTNIGNCCCVAVDIDFTAPHGNPPFVGGMAQPNAALHRLGYELRLTIAAVVRVRGPLIDRCWQVRSGAVVTRPPPRRRRPAASGASMPRRWWRWSRCSTGNAQPQRARGYPCSYLLVSRAGISLNTHVEYNLSRYISFKFKGPESHEIELGSQLHVRGVGVHGWDGTAEGRGAYHLRIISMATKILDWLRFTYGFGELVSVMTCRSRYETEAALRTVFAPFGHLVQATVRHRLGAEGGRATNTSWALVTMLDRDSAERALAAAVRRPWRPCRWPF